MSFHAITWALKQKTEGSGTKLLLIMLSNYADKQNECYPSIPHLSELCGCSKSSVARYTRKLVKQGFGAGLLGAMFLMVTAGNAYLTLQRGADRLWADVLPSQTFPTSFRV